MASRPGVAALGALAGAGAAAAVWGIGIERHLFTVRHHTVRVLEPGAIPLRVLHVSDAHMAPWQRGKQEWMANLASLRPDLVVNTGDNLGHREGLAGIRRAFEPFAGIPGVFVHGSNDLYEPSPRNPLRYILGPSERATTAPKLNTAALDAFFADELGWTSLNNAAATLDVRGTAVKLFGVSDAHHDLDDLDALPAHVATLPSAPVSIGVTHAPYRRVLDAFTELGADVLIAGHTHGGQVRVPFYGALVSNCDLPPKQARGLSSWTHDGRTVPLNVSAGLGHSIYSPVRFACPPEVSLLTLAPRAR